MPETLYSGNTIKITLCRFALYVTKVAEDYIDLSGHCYIDDFSREIGLREDVPAVSYFTSDSYHHIFVIAKNFSSPHNNNNTGV